MARRSRNPVQLPKGASGVRLCRHKTSGGCGTFCQYRLFTKIVIGTLLVLAGICVAIAVGTPDGATRVRDTALGVGTFIVIVIPLIVIENWRDRD